MDDLQETPATPPEEYGGDERAGLLAAGCLLVVLGWGVGVILNVVVHLLAPSTGTSFGPWTVYPTFGLWAWGAALVGLFAGALGAAMLALGWSAPAGRLVLPGHPYR